MKIIYTFGLLVFSLISSAQIKITGKVISDKDSTLAGVSVIIKGTSSGVVTGNDGSFSITQKTSDTLVISLIGYNTVEISVSSINKNVIIVLKEKADVLRDVIVVSNQNRIIRCYKFICGLPRIESNTLQKTSIDSTLNKINSKPRIKIYPNPTSGLATLSSLNNIEEIIVLDFGGKQLQKIIVNDRASVKLDLSKYPSGTYLIKYLTKNKKQEIEKLIVMH